MNKIPTKIIYLIYGICALIFITLNFGLGEKLQIGLTESLQDLTDYFFGISINTLDYLIFASFPFFGMIYNSKRIRFKVKELIRDIINVLFFVIIAFGIGLFIMVFSAKHSNPLIPDYLKTEPFDLYSTILIGIGILMPYLIKIDIKKIKDSFILKRSNYGADYGWYIEYEKNVLGELKYRPDLITDWGITYEIIAKSRELNHIIYDNSLWINQEFKFRNKKYDRKLIEPLVGGSGIYEMNESKLINIKYLFVSEI